MASVGTYLNFPGNTEKAFSFYRAVFGTEFVGPIQRMGDLPPMPGAPPMTEAHKKLVLHIALPILGGHLLMGTDAVAELGHPCVQGNNVSIQLRPDTRAETDRLYAALSAGGKATTPPRPMFWGAYFGACTDRFGIQWMFNCTAEH